jgi:hypothetical protein
VVTRAPFCPLPRDVRALVGNGFYSGRSPDVLGVTRAELESEGIAWPAQDGVDVAVPLAIFGTGVDPAAELPDGTTLDRVAPTLAAVLGFERPHPEVRSGTPIDGVANGDPPALVVEIVWAGIGSRDLRSAPVDWRGLRRLVQGGPFTLEASAGSLPLDPAAVLTTIGTGGLPAQHGITGGLIRSEEGEVVRPWSRTAPPSVIATLPDDLDEAAGGAARIGLVAADGQHRGLIGGTWYVPHDRDDLVDPGRDPVRAVLDLLATGYGSDGVPDVLAVVLEGSVPDLARATTRIADRVLAARPRTAFVVTATGPSARASAQDAGLVERGVDEAFPEERPIVRAATPGGLFLDQEALAESGRTSGDAVEAMLAIATADGHLFADAFPGFAITFARYC